MQAGRAPAEEWPLAPAKAAATVAGRQSTSALHRESLWEPIFGLLAFVIPRLLFAALILIFIIFFTYLGLDMAGGTDFWTALREAVPNTVAYLGRLMQGDLGMTTTASGTARPVPIAEVLAIWLPRSLGLLAISLIFASVVGVLLGVRAATRGAAHSLTIIVATIVGVSVPSFFAAFLLQWLVINATQMAGRTLLPAGGFGWDSHLILPGLVLAARPLAQITRITFVSVGDVLREDFVRTARSKGLRGRQVMFQHVMRNAAIPILTTMGVSLRFALTTLPIVEFYFGWLGAGYLLLKSIGQQDEELTIALVLCLGLLFIIVNFILEVSYRFLDPRLRTRPAHVAAGRPQSLFESLRSAWSDLGDLLTDNPIANWIKRRNGPPVESPFRAALERVGIDVDADDTLVPGAGRTVRRLLGNVPLVVGGLLVLVLLVVFVFGPNLAPNSPFTTLGLQKIDGQLTPPPFPPGEQFPWGTDALGRGVLSLVLAGARQTLTLAAVAVVARMFVGIFLGAIAGWTNGSRLDRVIVGAAEIIAAYPTLLLAMIIILAIGIRQGMMPFIIALTMVGWGETMQYVRSEVMSIRPKPFIESAVAIGARTPRIIGRHILPILFSSLISIGALEMGSVLMLLGELGFINIFIGGGSLIELPTETILYSDVPEWGALLSNVRYYAHGYPWTAMYPMLALFVAVLAFNLFGEGIRRLVAQGHLVINRFFNRYTLALAIVAVVGLIWLRQNMGAMPYYRDFAKEFDGQEAMAYVTELTEPTMDGRSLGTAGMDKAADYIADEMVRLGLQAGGQKNTLFQERRRSYEMLDATPVFTIDDGGPEPTYGQDFAVYPSQSASLGQVAKPVRFIGLGQVSAYQGAVWRVVYPDLERVDFSNDIVLVLSDREAAVMEYRADGGLLIVTDDPDKLSQSYTLGSLYFGQPAPKLWISEEMADRLLAPSGHTVAELREQVDRLPAE
ncbi:MAG: ABC transporter permease subunit, partial [Candidatus Promineifilaceae bacterium]